MARPTVSRALAARTGAGLVLAYIDVMTNREQPIDYYDVDESSDYTHYSNSWADVDATNLNLSITTSGGDVLVHFHGMCWGGDDVSVRMSVLVDGSTRLGGNEGIAGWGNSSTGGAYQEGPITFTRLITGLSAASHTFKLQWKGGYQDNINMAAGAGTSDKDVEPQFWVREII